MSVDGNGALEDSEIADCDGEKVVTMMDVLQEQQEFEEDANAVLGASDDKNCTYVNGYIKRQAIYACMTCCADAKSDPTKRAGVCLACSLSCHENHELIELYTKRNFRCDCGNPKFNSNPCQFNPNKMDLNEDNRYNQNYSGVYCICHRPYPDLESTVEEVMIQCIICEDWLHASHLNAAVPAIDQYDEMICKGCMERNEFIHDYSDLAVIVENVDIEVGDKSISNGDTTNSKVMNGDNDNSVKLDSRGISQVKVAEDFDVKDNTDKTTDSKTSPEQSSISFNNDENIKGSEENFNINPENLSAAANNQNKDMLHKENQSENLAENSEKHNCNRKETEIFETVPSTKKEDCSNSKLYNNLEINNGEGDESINNTNILCTQKPNNSLEENSKKISSCVDAGTTTKIENLVEPTVKHISIVTVTTNELTDNQEIYRNSQTNKVEIDSMNTEQDIKVEQLNKSISNPSDITYGKDLQIKTGNSTKEVSEESVHNEGSKTELGNKELLKSDLSTNIKKNKRKLSAEHNEDEVSVKKMKYEEMKSCVRPKGVKKYLEGATFWRSNFRQKLCTCNECLCMYKDLDVLFLIDTEDTVTAYETLGKERTQGSSCSQYEKGLQALSSLDRTQQINALTEYNKMRDKLIEFLQNFKDREEIVKAEDIKAFFAGMKPKREPDGVYFCR